MFLQSYLCLFLFQFFLFFSFCSDALKEQSLFNFTEEELEQFNKESICFQKRSRSGEDKIKFESTCENLLGKNINLCDNVKCEPIKQCPSGLSLIQNVVGAGCCAGCVKYLNRGERCQQDSVLERCLNGLDCHPSKGVCDVPRNQNPCIIDYYNRNLFSSKGKKFYVSGEISSKTLMIQYFTDMELPSCNHQSHDYEIKQVYKSGAGKSYCVNPKTGKTIFGVADFSKMNDVTCKCSNAMYEKLSKFDLKNMNAKEKSEELERLDEVNTNHFADTHIKCTSTGDYHQMQCINETCLCVNEGSGVPLTTLGDFTKLLLENNLSSFKEKVAAQDSAKPRKDSDNDDSNNILPTVDPEKLVSKEIHSSAVAMFGAFKALPCFDLERAKQVGSNHSRRVYNEDCQEQIHQSMFIQQHFSKKGTKVRGLEDLTCGPDDRFSRRQCLPDSCLCSNPFGLSLGSYGVEKSNAEDMDCLCALEEYFIDNDRKGFDKMNCDGRGNFAALQCVGQSCYCADEKGMQISEKFSFECISDFFHEHAPSFRLELICSAMRATISNPKKVYAENTQMYFDTITKSFIARLETPSTINEFPC